MRPSISRSEFAGRRRRFGAGSACGEERGRGGKRRERSGEGNDRTHRTGTPGERSSAFTGGELRERAAEIRRAPRNFPRSANQRSHCKNSPPPTARRAMATTIPFQEWKKSSMSAGRWDSSPIFLKNSRSLLVNFGSILRPFARRLVDYPHVVAFFAPPVKFFGIRDVPLGKSGGKEPGIVRFFRNSARFPRKREPATRPTESPSSVRGRGLPAPAKRARIR